MLLVQGISDFALNDGKEVCYAIKGEKEIGCVRTVKYTGITEINWNCLFNAYALKLERFSNECEEDDRKSLFNNSQIGCFNLREARAIKVAEEP